MEAYGGGVLARNAVYKQPPGPRRAPKCPEMTEKQIVEIFLLDFPAAGKYENGQRMEPDQFVFSLNGLRPICGQIPRPNDRFDWTGVPFTLNGGSRLPGLHYYPRRRTIRAGVDCHGVIAKVIGIG